MYQKINSKEILVKTINVSSVYRVKLVDYKIVKVPEYLADNYTNEMEILLLCNKFIKGTEISRMTPELYRYIKKCVDCTLPVFNVINDVIVVSVLLTKEVGDSDVLFN